MSLPDYLNPTEQNKIASQKEYSESQWGSQLQFNVEDYSGIDIAIFDVAEDRGSLNNKGAIAGGELVRKKLYSLFRGDYKMKVADLGSIQAGNSLTDTYFAVKETIRFLLRKGVLPIIIGGTKDLTYGIYLAYSSQEQLVNLVSIDSQFPLGKADETINDANYLSKVLFHEPSALFNFSNIGYQSYFVDQKELELLDELFFDNYRLGLVRENIKLAEPIIRNADFLSFSLSAIAQRHAPANKNTSPNGFSSEQSCQLARYAGMNDKLTSIGFFDFNPSSLDPENTAHLIAQMIWYFVDGYYHRKGDFPVANKSDYTKYSISMKNQDIVFYKSPKTDRWWMEIPYLSTVFKKYKNHLMLPCNYDEYLTASSNEIPERWFQTFKKLK